MSSFEDMTPFSLPTLGVSSACHAEICKMFARLSGCELTSADEAINAGYRAAALFALSKTDKKLSTALLYGAALLTSMASTAKLMEEKP